MSVEPRSESPSPEGSSSGRVVATCGSAGLQRPSASEVGAVRVFEDQPAHCAVHSPASWPEITLSRFQVLMVAIQMMRAASARSS